jgi:hypothetical protein
MTKIVREKNAYSKIGKREIKIIKRCRKKSLWRPTEKFLFFSVNLNKQQQQQE